MAGIENVGYIVTQGKVGSRKAGNGYVLMSGFWPKTFSTFEGAVMYASKKNIKLRSHIPAEVQFKADANLKAERERAAERAALEEAAALPPEPSFGHENDSVWGPQER